MDMMLDRASLLQQINFLCSSLFLPNQFFSKLNEISVNFIEKAPSLISLLEYNKDLFLPSFEGIATKAFPILAIEKYSILSVDGSQIYPDRHFNISCYLINIGIVQLNYNMNIKPVTFSTVPYLFSPQNFLSSQSISIINSQRQELEFKIGLEQAILMKNKQAEQLFILFDGALIFWHLENKALKEQFFPIYLHRLQGLADNNILTASYISLPKSRELVSLLRAFICQQNLEIDEEVEASLEKFTDATFASLFLNYAQRTAVFISTLPQVKGYTKELTPCFFYLHVGMEIGRVEIPFWLASKPEYVEYVASCILDQATKGRGYPIVLAEAHEQAVIKGPDRDFFYQLLTKVSLEHKQKVKISAKSFKKKGMNF